VHPGIVGDDHHQATATSAELMNGSAATLSPTCFIATRARLPDIDTPSAAS
jgi:hypothetical protein